MYKLSFWLDRIFPLFLVLCAMSWTLVEMLLPGAVRLQIINILFISAACGAIISYAPVIYHLGLTGWRDRNNLFADAIVWWCVSVIWVRSWVMYWESIGAPDHGYIRYAHTPGLFIGVVATFMLIIAPQYNYGVVAKRSWVTIGLIVAAGSAVLSLWLNFK